MYYILYCIGRYITVGLGDFQPKVNPPYGCRVFGAKLYCSMDKIGLINAFHVEKI